MIRSGGTRQHGVTRGKGAIWARMSLPVLVCLIIAQQAAPAQTFVLCTQAAGLSTVIGTNGVAVADFDRDGDLDVYFVAQVTFKQNDKRTWNRLFAGNGDGTFQDVTAQSGITFPLSRVAS